MILQFEPGFAERSVLGNEVLCPLQVVNIEDRTGRHEVGWFRGVAERTYESRLKRIRVRFRPELYSPASPPLVLNLDLGVGASKLLFDEAIWGLRSRFLAAGTP